MYTAVRLLVAWGVNVLALMVADWVFSGFAIERWGPLPLAGAVAASSGRALPEDQPSQ